ncbi:MAG: HAD hydrolase family protein, partial [Herbinix sp.]|nr:HAD hydrolase family protein [Herbinix sp.]
MKRKLLAMDVDGTAVRDDYKLGHVSKKAIERARQAGHVIAFVTGRRDIDMLSMGRDGRCVDYLILNNGGKILRCEDEAVLFNDLIDPESCKKLITYCLDNQLQLQICSGLLWKVSCMTESTLEYARSV